MKDPILMTAWSAKKENGARIHPHSHCFHELVYYRAGEGSTTIDGKAHTFAADTFALLPENVRHDETHQREGKLICIGFQAAFDLPAGVFRDKDGSVRRVVNAILAEATEQPPQYRDMLAVRLRELLITTRRVCDSAAHAAPKDFSYAINYIAENYHEKLLLQELAAQLYVSYDYFRHRFQQLTGSSPQQFLIAKRLSAAKELLQKGDLSCTEIAQSCGFSNSAQFSMLFKRAYGISPSQYRPICGTDPQTARPD